jgi:hypothetical protein
MPRKRKKPKRKDPLCWRCARRLDNAQLLERLCMSCVRTLAQAASYDLVPVDGFVFMFHEGKLVGISADPNKGEDDPIYSINPEWLLLTNRSDSLRFGECLAPPFVSSPSRT